MSEAEEDFSFPTTVDTPPRFIGSPPLWQPEKFSFSSSPTKTPERDEDNLENYYFYATKISTSMPQRKSFSYVERGTKTKRVGFSDDDEEEEEEEEKMDMLWEDFNEEFSARNSKKATEMADSDYISPRKMLNFGCVQALKLSKANKKPSIVVFMKVLKKMFLNQVSHRPVKKNHHQW